MVIEISTLISIVSVAIAVITIIYNISRNGKKDVTEDVKEDATQMATVITELKSISNGINAVTSHCIKVKDSSSLYRMKQLCA